jgi:hypothetical protein
MQASPFEREHTQPAASSVPRDHLANELSIETEFWYEWENRDNELGDYPECFVSFERKNGVLACCMDRGALRRLL